MQVDVLGADVAPDDQGRAVPAGQEGLVREIQCLHRSGTARLELKGRRGIDAEAVGDQVDGRRQQRIGHRRTHHDEIHVAGGEPGPGQGLPGRRLAQVGQRPVHLAGVQVDGEVAGAGTDEGVDPLLDDGVHSQTLGQPGVVDRRPGQRGAHRHQANVSCGHCGPSRRDSVQPVWAAQSTAKAGDGNGVALIDAGGSGLVQSVFQRINIDCLCSSEHETPAHCGYVSLRCVVMCCKMRSMLIYVYRRDRVQFVHVLPPGSDAVRPGPPTGSRAGALRWAAALLCGGSAPED